MKTAKLFLAGMYVHLVLSVVVPTGILYLGWGSGWNRGNASLLALYLLEVLMLQVLGWVSAGAAIRPYRRNALDRLLSGWRTLKLWSVPFYILNFLWSFLVWGAITAASRGVLLILTPIPVCVTWLMVMQSGVTGWLAIRNLRETGTDVSVLHSVCQFLPVLDVLSTLLLLRRTHS